MSERALIAVDVGNSCIKLALPESSLHADQEMAGSPAISTARIPLQDPQWCSRVAAMVRQWLGGPVTSTRWAVVSVNAPAAELLRQQVAQCWPTHQWHLFTRHDIALPLQVDSPDQLGIDRIVGGYGALRRVAGDSVITIDAGSAVTIDLISEGIFVGGAILPGMRLQFESLGQGTDRLPRIPTSLPVVPGEPDRCQLPGRNTQAAMWAGVVLGIAGAIERIVDALGGTRADVPPVVLTGGDAALLADRLRCPCRLEPDLVVRTILTLEGAGRANKSLCE